MIKRTAEIVTVTKELVEELLRCNSHNRPIRKTVVEYLRRELREGRWRFTNQGIGVSVSGFLCDGQHRLIALQLEGYPPVEILLVRGLSDDAQKYVDQHAKRTMTDVVALFFDKAISSKLVAALNVVLYARSGWSRANRPGPDALIEEFVALQESIQALGAIPNSSRIHAAATAALLDAMRHSEDERACLFAEQIIRGEMLKAGDPALTLRNWLATTSGYSGNMDTQRERYLKTLSAWEAFSNRRQLFKLYVSKPFEKEVSK